MQRIIIVVVLILFAVLMVVFAAWKTGQQWQSAHQCRCGNLDALFSKSDEFFASHVLGNSLEVLAILGAIILLLNFPLLGHVASGIVCGYLLYQFFAQLDARNVYVQLVRNTALLEALILIVPWFFIAGKNMLYYRH
jgi:hypothetical protein